MKTTERMRKIARRALRRSWRGLREWCGDTAYETYLQSRASGAGTSRPLTEKEFYLERLDRRYSQPNRCC